MTADDVSFLVDQKLRPLGVLQAPGGAEPALEAPNPLLALRLKYVVSDPAVTRRIAAVFAPLFHPVIVAAFTAAFLFALGWIVVEKGLASAFHQAIYEPGLLLVVLALTIVSAAFHELGHAAACRYSGADPGAMGVGLYLVWPAFYTDVTDSYRLDRRSRLRVDLGGIYFNAIFAVATAVTSVAAGWDALLLVVAAQVYLMIRQLIPIVRFDGYHVLADLVGVPDLLRRIKPTLLSAFRRGRDASVRLRPWARRSHAPVLAVVPLLAAMLLFVVLMLPRILATAADSFALQWDAAASEWRAADVTAVASALVSMLLIALPMVGIPYMIGRLGWRAGHSTWQSAAGRPAARAAVALGGLAVLGALAWAWWPHDQYRPLEPTERWGLSSSVRALPQGEAVLGAVPVVEPDSRPKRAFMVALMTTLPDGSAGPIVVVAPGLDPPDKDTLEAATETVAAQTTPTPTTTATPTPLPGDRSAATTTSGEFERVAIPVRAPASGAIGDDQVVVVNTGDNRFRYSSSLSLIWVTGEILSTSGTRRGRSQAARTARRSDRVPGRARSRIVADRYAGQLGRRGQLRVSGVHHTCARGAARPHADRGADAGDARRPQGRVGAAAE